MNTSISGQKSHRILVAIFSLFFLLLGSNVLLGGPASPWESTPPGLKTWTFTHPLDATTFPPSEVKVDFLFCDPTCSLDVQYREAQQALIFSLSYPDSKSLADESKIAQIQVGSGLAVKHFTLVADGGAIALLVDEF
jgi:hypothetical protein